ncbi:MAG: hypothetical protein U1F48_15430 [Burkholderiales bacterium]
MGLLDRLREGMGVQRPPAADDERAIARYRYLLQTAPPETIEQAHAEAFAQLSPEQRRRVLQDLAAAVPAGGERDAVLRAGDQPASLARVATRAEVRQPGVLERIFGGAGPAGSAAPGAMPGLGGMVAGTFLSSLAGTVLGSVIAQQFFHAHPAAGLFGDGATSHDAPPFWADREGSTTATDSGFTEAVDDGGSFDGDGDTGFDGFDV